MTLRCQLRIDAARVDIGPVGHKEFHHLRLALGGSPHQRGLPSPKLPCVDLCSRSDERRGRFDVAGARNDHQRCLALWVRGVGVGAGVEQRFDDGRRANRSGFQ